MTIALGEATFSAWVVAGIPQAPGRAGGLVPGDEIMIVFTAERMRQTGRQRGPVQRYARAVSGRPGTIPSIGAIALARDLVGAVFQALGAGEFSRVRRVTSSSTSLAGVHQAGCPAPR